MPDQLPDADTLRSDAASMGVELSDNQATRVLRFGGLVLHWNLAFNLVSRKDQDRLYHRHLLDSLSLVPWLRGLRVLDLGTGAGLPGLPLAIACPDRSFTLIDRNERKIRLVRQAVRQLGLGNVEALCGDAVTLATGGGYDVVVTRAVAAAAESWRLARGAMRPGGRLLVMAWGQSAGATTIALPAEARIVAREHVVIPGLAQPHGLLVIEEAPAVADSMET